MSTIPLTNEEIITFTDSQTDWKFENDRLMANFKLASFDQAITVINEMATVARQMDHHPFLTNVYNQLSFSLCTHHVGDKVTEKDIKLAKEISTIIQNHQK